MLIAMLQIIHTTQPPSAPSQTLRELTPLIVASPPESLPHSTTAVKLALESGPGEAAQRMGSTLTRTCPRPAAALRAALLAAGAVVLGCASAAPYRELAEAGAAYSTAVVALTEAAATA